jgi:uncharacterized protein (TIGR02145 family)
MKYSLAAIAIITLLILACGEVGNNSEEGTSSGVIDPGVSSPNPGGSSSSGTTVTVCQPGEFCCNGRKYDNSTNFCYEDELYPRCGTANYNPFEQGCFEGKLYARCDIDKTRGLCVYESLLRCKQEGTGTDKIVTPQPRMTCEANGTITGVTIDIFDAARIYKIVQIGNQIWLAENLKYTPTAGGGEGGPATNSKCHGDDSQNCTTYGNLYDWATAMNLPPACNGTNQSCPPRQGSGLYPGLCPPTFGFPKASDWQQLITYAGGIAVAGGRLKSTTGWSNNGNGTDSYGFNALPGGIYTELNPTKFAELGSRAIWWHDEESLPSEAHYTTIISSDTEAKINFHSKGYNMAQVRCLHYF